ncbi:hypothetical protein HMPREF9417_1086 [Haemophilus parainfluenzae ATCC 33392]|jgi:raw score 13.86|nr:hypothetical protein HMPREF9417_1086 [Haemophilus parainfluenzae ATCC 33392]
MPIVPILVQFLILLKEDISMKNLLKITAIAALTFSSISAFAASQQAEEVKKFKAWEETAGQKLEASFDAIATASSSSNVTATEAAVAEFDKKAAEHVAELEALGIKSEEVSPLVSMYKEYVDAEKEVAQLILSQVKSPSADNAGKVPEAVAKANAKDDAIDKLADQLEEKFPAEE